MHLEQWAADCAAPGEQSWTSCRSWDLNPQPWVTSGFKSNALSTRPRLPYHSLMQFYSVYTPLSFICSCPIPSLFISVVSSSAHPSFSIISSLMQFYSVYTPLSFICSCPIPSLFTLLSLLQLIPLFKILKRYCLFSLSLSLSL